MKTRKKAQLMLYLVCCLNIANASGIINTETVLSKEESDAKKKIEDKAREIKESIDKYKIEIDSTNEVLSAQIVELIKIREMKKRIYIENNRFYHKCKKQTQTKD